MPTQNLLRLYNCTIVTVADVDAEDHVGNSLLIRELTFGHKAKLCSDVEHKVWSRFRS